MTIAVDLGRKATKQTKRINQQPDQWQLESYNFQKKNILCFNKFDLVLIHFTSVPISRNFTYAKVKKNRDFFFTVVIG